MWAPPFYLRDRLVFTAQTAIVLAALWSIIRWSTGETPPAPPTEAWRKFPRASRT